MNRIFSACLSIVASAIFILPIFVIGNQFVFRNRKHTTLYTIFAFYLIAVMSLVGLPDVKYIRFELSLNVIPFVDMVSDIKNALLNILLFVPMGFFLPILWERCRPMKNTIIHCLWITGIIEILQIFTFRTTDINDMITNTLGGAIGYFIARGITKGFTKHVCFATKAWELYVVFAIAFAVMFFGVPFSSGLLWEFVL